MIFVSNVVKDSKDDKENVKDKIDTAVPEGRINFLSHFLYFI